MTPRTKLVMLGQLVLTGQITPVRDRRLLRAAESRRAAAAAHCPVWTDRRILVGGTEQYSGFFGIPEATPRSLMIANAGVFTAMADVDRLAEAIEAVAKAG